MKIYRDEKRQDGQGMILFIESFANVKYFRFLVFIRAFLLLDERKSSISNLKQNATGENRILTFSYFFKKPINKMWLIGMV